MDQHGAGPSIMQPTTAPPSQQLTAAASPNRSLLLPPSFDAAAGRTTHPSSAAIIQRRRFILPLSEAAAAASVASGWPNSAAPPPAPPESYSVLLLGGPLAGNPPTPVEQVAAGIPNLDSLVELLNGDDGTSWARLVDELILEIPAAPLPPSGGCGGTGSGPGGNGAPHRNAADAGQSHTESTASPVAGLMPDDVDVCDGIPAAWADCVRLLGD